MANPTRGVEIRAKETGPTFSDDILGKFRSELVRKVQGAIVYHRDNAADPALEFYRLGVFDSLSTQLGRMAGFTDFHTERWWKKNGANLTMADAFGPPTLELPDDGQVAQNAGDSLVGQISFWDVNGGAGIDPTDGQANVSRVGSVATQIMQHTYALTRVRKCNMTTRMATTKVSWQSKTYPHTFNHNGKDYLAEFKGDQLKRYEDLYGFAQQSAYAGMTHMAEPFRGAPNGVVFGNTVYGDVIRGPRTDTANQGGGRDPYGVLITADNLIEVFNRMNNIWEAAKEYDAAVTIDYCHSSCHASCHSSRSRR